MNRLRILNDFAFQKALGEKGDEPQLLSFLNAVLERTGKNNLESVEILEAKDLSAATAGGKAAKLDVLARLSTGSKVNIEVQNKNEYNIEKRSLYYWSRKYIEDLRSGEDYIDLVPVIGINIVDFGYGPVEDFHTSYHLWEDRHKEALLTEVCEIHFLDMVKFRRSRERDLEDPLNRWLVYFDEHSPADLIEEVVKMDTAIQMTQEKLEMIARDPGLRRAYESIEKAERDYISGMNGARREAAEAARKEAEAARKEAEAVRGTMRETVRNLKADGVPTEQISKWTGLSEAQIKEL
jgi:predicted transposase/invertase (TIGR01784 family)